MVRNRRLVKTAVGLIAVAVVAVAISGCAFIKPGSLSVSQPQGIGSAHVHFNLCTIGDTGAVGCGPNGEGLTAEYLIGIAVPAGSVPPASFTAVPVGGGVPIAFTRSDEVASELAGSSAALQKTLSGVTQKEREEFEELDGVKELIGTAWPPSGLQGFGYLSAPVTEAKEASAEWSVDTDFGLPGPAGTTPFAGPFPAAVAMGFRIVGEGAPATRPVHCVRFELPEVEPQVTDSFCAGTTQQAQVGTSELLIGAPAKPSQAFVGGKGTVSFPLTLGSTAVTPPTFALSATTTAKGGKAKLGSGTFTPTSPDPSTHLSPTGSGKVTVTLPRKVKPGTYQVTLTAKTTQGATVSGVAKLKVTKPKLKFGKAKVDAAKGTATLKVKVPGAGKLTVAGKGVKTVKMKSKKAKTLTVKIAATGSAAGQLASAGSVKVKLKATFKPSSGISVSKTKSVVLTQG